MSNFRLLTGSIILISLFAACDNLGIPLPTKVQSSQDPLLTNNSPQRSNPGPAPGTPSGPFTVTSNDFTDGVPVSTAPSSMGMRGNPHLSWSNAPAGTTDFYIFMQHQSSPDVPYWLRKDLSTTTELSTAQPPSQNDLIPYTAPRDTTSGNQYVFTIYAVEDTNQQFSAQLSSSAQLSWSAVKNLLDANSLDSASITLVFASGTPSGPAPGTPPGPNPQPNSGPAPQPFTVTSNDFTDGVAIEVTTSSSIPGKPGNPQLSWSNAPAGTAELYIFMQHLESLEWTHWLRKESVSITELAANLSPTTSSPNDLHPYDPPQYPFPINNYVFTVYAIDQASSTPLANLLNPLLSSLGDSSVHWPQIKTILDDNSLAKVSLTLLLTNRSHTP